MLATLTMRDPTISVVLCTRNGARFLGEQLDSIEYQSRRADELIVVDDCSTDSTTGIVEAFARKSSIPVRLERNSRPLGIIRNFERALEYATGTYVALCDQDDIWMPSKLEISVSAISATERERGSATPILVHSDLRLVGARGELISDSFFQFQGMRREHPQPLGELAIENYVTGCASVLNRALLDLALPIPPAALMHDWWLGLVAAAAGEVITLSDTTVSYRQHGRNAIGATRRSWRRYVFGWSDLVVQLQARRSQMRAVLDRVRDIPGASERAAFVVQALEGRGLSAVLRARSYGIRAQRLAPTLALQLFLLLGALGASTR